jgi:hypothetical protein
VKKYSVVPKLPKIAIGINTSKILILVGFDLLLCAMRRW